MNQLLRYLIISACSLILCPNDAGAQKFINMDDEFGLGYVEITHEDRYGLLWIASRNGLYTYDGYTIRQYTNDPADTTTIPDNNVLSVGEGASGKIWVCLGSKGLAFLDRNQDVFQSVCPTGQGFDCSAEVSYHTTLQDTSGLLWIGTSRGLLLMDENAQVVEWYNYSESDSTSMFKNYVMDLFLDDRQRLWVGTYSGINLFERNTGTFLNPRTNASYPIRQVIDINQRPGGEIIICPRFGDACLLEYDEETGNFLPMPGFQDRSMGEFKIAFDHDKNMWISSRGVGAYMQPYNTDEVISFLPSQAEVHGYRNVYGLEVMTDRYGNVWFAGPQLHYMPSSGKNIRNISSEGNITISVYADEDRVIYCAEQPYVLDRSTLETKPFWHWGPPTNLRGENRNRTPRFYKYVPLNDRQLIIVASRNIYLWDRIDDTYIEYAGDFGGPFRDIALDSTRRCLWICGNQGNPIHFDLGKGEFSRPADLNLIRNPQTVEMGLDGRVWFGTLGSGVFQFDPDSGELVQFSSDSPRSRRTSSSRVNDIEIDDKGNVWIAGTLGLNHWREGADSVAIYRKDHPGLESDLLSTVIADDSGQIWLGTGDGLSVFDPQTTQFRHFNQRDGLINSYFIARACYKDFNGTLYFGGNQGIDFFDPSEMGSNQIPPNIYVSSIRVNEQDYKTDSTLFKPQKIDLAHTQNFVEVELLALHTTAPHANQYAYRIKEIRNDWIDLGQRRIVSLANSSPGTFTIEAKASNADGVWCPPKELLTVVIRPPFYRTWWFISLSALILAIILYSGYRYRINQIRKKEQLKTKFEKQIAQLEMKALRAQMNPHFLFNSLNSIKSLISAGETENAAEYVTRFSQLIRQVLSNSERSAVRLQEDLNALRLYMEIERLRFQNFTYNIEVTDDVNADFIEVPPLLLQPYVENAIWHGLLHKTDGERKLDVRVDQKDGVLIMEVQDNGIGRARAKSIKMRGGSRKGGLGMKITGDRIRVLKDYYGQEATVEIVDLKEPDGSSNGTMVRVCIPVAD